jgi:transcriptional regulator with GAF, ATPase, and Fis domain
MKRFITPLILTAVSLLIAFLLRSPLAVVEEEMTNLKYQLRGEQRADSNIVIIYIDNAAINALGYPLRRNFYALMVNALADVQAKVVGVDVVFENPNLEYPEYDQLLQHTMLGAKNVVLASYFKSLENEPRTATKELELLDALHFPQVANVRLHGGEFHTPHEGLLQAASGIGHVNVAEGERLPMFVSYGRGIVPSFAVELLRQFCGVEREGISFDGETMKLKREGKLIEVADDAVLNFAGDIRSFTTYPFLEVLKSYDAARAGEKPTIAVQTLKDKVVLIGLIAEGQLQTHVATPFDERFPPVGLHATFLDTALRSGFVRTASLALVMALCALVGFVCAASASLIPPKAGLARQSVPLATILGVAVISFFLFTSSSFVLPVVPLVVVGLVATASAFFVRHRSMKKELTNAQAEAERVTVEKETIQRELRDREAKVASLERELVEAQTRQATADRTSELLEEIRRYKAEIHTLSAQQDDMEAAAVEPTAESERKEFEGIVYSVGGAMQSVVDFIAKIAGSDATVLILGESGTGKEMAARAIHKRSGRAQKQFVAVNCGALAENLLESELFGHEKGSFTGAVKDKLGRFELADGGTIFLDEIGEVNEAFQLKLLRVLQEGEFERVGGTKTMKVNVRVIAATNKDLKLLVKEKRFREDVFYRLNVLSIELPPLRERAEDIPLLVNYFLQKEGGMNVSKNVLDALQRYAWRGNIRELESVVKRAVLLARAEHREMIAMKDLSEEISAASKGAVAFEDQILESLREKGFSRSAISETADELGGLNRGTVAEHFRGICLKAFVEHAFNLDEAARYVSLSADAAANDRVRKKLQEYLSNIADAVDTTQTWDVVKPSLKPKMKNLPQKYQPFLEQAAETFYRGVWKTPLP